jgi:hypothetical protein
MGVFKYFGGMLKFARLSPTLRLRCDTSALYFSTRAIAFPNMPLYYLHFFAFVGGQDGRLEN